MLPYKYGALAPNRDEVRLLRLLPGAASADIVIEIFHERFTSSLPYEALSYVWGSPERTNIIFVEEQPLDDPTHSLHPVKGVDQDWGRTTVKRRGTLSVTTNLEVALRYLRHPHNTRVLWIDAVSINQEDLSERSAQVAKMGSIYAIARQVIVWLGPESENSSLAISILRAIEKDMDISDTGNTISTRQGSSTEHLERNTQAMRSKVLSWIAVRDLLSRKWFSRLWIFQEIGLASKAVIVVGKDELPWNSFKVVVSWIWNRVIDLSPISDLIDRRNMEAVTSLIIPVVGKLGPTMSLAQLLELTKRSFCFDPRDRVYSLLSLLRPQDRRDISPDYSVATEMVYKNLVLRNVKRTGQLELLRLCEIRSSSSTLRLPSWVPDLSIPKSTYRLPYCNAALLSREETTYNESDDSLQVRGLRTATITHVSASISHIARLPEILAICHAWEPHDILTAEYVGGGSLLDAFASTLICGFVEGDVPPNLRPSLNLNDCRKQFKVSVREGKADGRTAHYTGFLQLMLPGRSFFMTEEGYIGLCPATARPGDQVLVLLGCPAPILLRPVPERKCCYQVVGECFVQGLMRGEGLLGPLLPRWTKTWAIVDGKFASVYTQNDSYITQQDQILGHMDHGWKVVYGEANDQEHHEFGHGNMKSQWFENMKTGEKSNWDPRLTSQALIGIGVEIQDYTLI